MLKNIGRNAGKKDTAPPKGNKYINKKTIASKKKRVSERKKKVVEKLTTNNETETIDESFDKDVEKVSEYAPKKKKKKKQGFFSKKITPKKPPKKQPVRRKKMLNEQEQEDVLKNTDKHVTMKQEKQFTEQQELSENVETLKETEIVGVSKKNQTPLTEKPTNKPRMRLRKPQVNKADKADKIKTPNKVKTLAKTKITETEVQKLTTEDVIDFNKHAYTANAKYSKEYLDLDKLNFKGMMGEENPIITPTIEDNSDVDNELTLNIEDPFDDLNIDIPQEMQEPNELEEKVEGDSLELNLDNLDEILGKDEEDTSNDQLDLINITDEHIQLTEEIEQPIEEPQQEVIDFTKTDELEETSPKLELGFLTEDNEQEELAPKLDLGLTYDINDLRDKIKDGEDGISIKKGFLDTVNKDSGDKMKTTIPDIDIYVEENAIVKANDIGDIVDHLE